MRSSAISSTAPSRPDSISPTSSSERGGKKSARPKAGRRVRRSSLEAVAAVQPQGTRLVRQVADAGAAATLVVERELRALVGDVVHIERRLPAIRLEAEAQVRERVARQQGIEGNHGPCRDATVGDQSRRIGIAGATDLTPARLLVLELRVGGSNVLDGKVGEE